ncbi:MAG: glutamate--tRNA ligase, partial [Clostridia bacterium]
MTKQLRTRFAPSPTGYLHIGGLRTALYSYLYAKKMNGKFILRIEDTDQERFVEGATELIYRTLRETGLYYDEGPDIGGAYGPYIQSERKKDYLIYAKQLVAQGDAYYCFCSKERLESLPDINGARRYDKHCLNLSKEEVEEKLTAGEPYVIRQNMPTTGSSTYHDVVYGDITVDNAELEDNILIKSDGMPTYNFANVIDDHLMDINCVMRGIEYLSSTPKYNLLYDAFGWERPIYIHMPPIMKDAQHKLSKRNGDASFEDLIKKGFLKEAILNYIALLGWSPKDDREKLSFDELKACFSIEGINKSPSIFDPVKLAWLNGEYIKEMPLDDFVTIATPWLDKSKVAGKYNYRLICALLQTRVETLAEIPEKFNFLEEYQPSSAEMYYNKKLKTDGSVAKEILPQVAKAFEEITVWSHDQIMNAQTQLVAKLNAKNGVVMFPTMIAISGQT